MQTLGAGASSAVPISRRRCAHFLKRKQRQGKNTEAPFPPSLHAGAPPPPPPGCVWSRTLVESTPPAFWTLEAGEFLYLTCTSYRRTTVYPAASCCTPPRCASTCRTATYHASLLAIRLPALRLYVPCVYLLYS